MNTQISVYVPRRLCGHRIGGGTYVVTDVENTVVHWESNGKEFKRPLDTFIHDPPVHIDIKDLGLSAQGINVLPRPDGSGIYDAFDIVGAQDYPYFPDWYHETLFMGTSRRWEGNEQGKALLTSKSKIHHIFRNGTILNTGDFHTERATDKICRSKNPHHQNIPVEMLDFAPCCTDLLWESISIRQCDRKIKGRAFERTHPSLSPYIAFTPPEDIDTNFDWAICVSLPITQFEVVKGNSYEDALKLLESLGNGIPYLTKDA
jgi:hypothetical protein